MTPLARLAGRSAAAALLLCAAMPTAHAGDVAAECRTQSADPRTYLDCLNLQQKASEQALQRSVDGVEAAIDARADLQPAQRRRWLSLFQESQGRFTNWRNFECQSIAPFESDQPRQNIGGRLGGIGVIEQRLVCLISHNELRARNLEARYAPAGGWPETAAPPPVAGSTPTDNVITGTTISPVPGVPRIIEMTP